MNARCKTPKFTFEETWRKEIPHSRIKKQPKRAVLAEVEGFVY